MALPLRSLALAPIAFLVLAAASAHAASASVAAARFLRPRTEPDAKRKIALVVRKSLKSKDPGYWRSSGVRGGISDEEMGALGDSGAAADAKLAVNPFAAKGAYKFPFLDNLEPIAPMDRLHAAVGTDSEAGHYINPIYVPKYLNPEAFPNVHGSGCNCTMATAEKPSVCTCGDDDHSKDHYTWLKDTPVPGTNNYTLEPADITYRHGNYWSPEIRGGLVAPADTMDPKRYPNQARGDHIWPLPVSSSKDRIGVRFARYIDQVQDRSEECDTISKKCTVPCKPGDEVVASAGNVDLDAKILKTFVGNAVEIEIIPKSALNAKETVECPLKAGCSSFRYCMSAELKHCVHIKDKETTNWAGMKTMHHVCPQGSQVCKSVKQVMMANLLKKGGKACKAAAL